MWRSLYFEQRWSPVPNLPLGMYSEMYLGKEGEEVVGKLVRIQNQTILSNTEWS